MSAKRFSMVLCLSLAAASMNTAIAGEHLLARVHGSVVAPSGSRTWFTELMFTGDVRANVTLWKGDDGHHYILRSSDNFIRKEGSVSFSDLDTKRFLKVTWVIPVDGSTPAQAAAAEKHLNAATYTVEQVTVKTASLTMTVPVSPSMTGQMRSALRRDLPPAFINALIDVTIHAATASSPAAQPACQYLASLFVDASSCRARGANAAPADDDCAFDAEFGYPCD
jgi:hypothetical protein